MKKILAWCLSAAILASLSGVSVAAAPAAENMIPTKSSYGNKAAETPKAEEVGIPTKSSYGKKAAETPKAEEAALPTKASYGKKAAEAPVADKAAIPMKTSYGKKAAEAPKADKAAIPTKSSYGKKAAEAPETEKAGIPTKSSYGNKAAEVVPADKNTIPLKSGLAIKATKAATTDEKKVPLKSSIADKSADPVTDEKDKTPVKAETLTPAQELTATQIYQLASEKTSALKSMQAKALADMKITVGDSSLNMNIHLDLKMNTSNNKLKMAAKGTANALDQKIAVNYYFKNGYYYMNIGDQKIKTKMNIDEMLESVSVFTPNTSEYLTVLSSKKSGTDTIIAYQIDQNVMKKYVDQVMGTMASGLPDGMSFAMGPMSGTATINKDGYITDNTANMSFTMSAEGEKMAIAMVMDCSYVNIGKNVTITFPNDLNAYKTMDAIK